MHLVGFHYKNISRCTVFRVSKTLILESETAIHQLAGFEQEHVVQQVTNDIERLYKHYEKRQGKSNTD